MSSTNHQECSRNSERVNRHVPTMHFHERMVAGDGFGDFNSDSWSRNGKIGKFEARMFHMVVEERNCHSFELYGV